MTAGPVKLIIKTYYHITPPFGLLEKMGIFVIVHYLNILHKLPGGTLASMETLITNSQLSNAFDSFVFKKFTCLL